MPSHWSLPMRAALTVGITRLPSPDLGLRTAAGHGEMTPKACSKRQETCRTVGSNYAEALWIVQERIAGAGAVTPSGRNHRISRKVSLSRCRFPAANAERG